MGRSVFAALLGFRKADGNTHFPPGGMEASERREKVVLGQRENLYSLTVAVSSEGRAGPLGTKQGSF